MQLARQNYFRLSKDLAVQVCLKLTYSMSLCVPTIMYNYCCNYTSTYYNACTRSTTFSVTNTAWIHLHTYNIISNTGIVLHTQMHEFPNNGVYCWLLRRTKIITSTLDWSLVPYTSPSSPIVIPFSLIMLIVATSSPDIVSTEILLVSCCVV